MSMLCLLFWFINYGVAEAVTRMWSALLFGMLLVKIEQLGNEK